MTSNYCTDFRALHFPTNWSTIKRCYNNNYVTPPDAVTLGTLDASLHAKMNETLKLAGTPSKRFTLN